MRKYPFSILLGVHAILLVILFFGLITIISVSSGKTLILELIGLLFLLVISTFGFMRAGKSKRTTVLFFVYTLYLLNIVLLWFFTERLYLTLAIIAVVGFIVGYPRKVTIISDNHEEEPHSMVFDPVQPEVHYEPGRYVASKRGKYFHEPKSEWAEKIKEQNRVWFKSKEDAWEAGYKAHTDVE